MSGTRVSPQFVWYVGFPSDSDARVYPQIVIFSALVLKEGLFQEFPNFPDVFCSLWALSLLATGGLRFNLTSPNSLRGIYLSRNLGKRSPNM